MYTTDGLTAGRGGVIEVIYTIFNILTKITLDAIAKKAETI